jgi:hypothetical protein
MRLVLQCSVCGTIHTVGTAVCGTCRASGIQSLRLLFECMRCFRLGLSPSCEVCSQLLSLDPDEAVPEGNVGVVAVGLWESEPGDEILEVEIEEESIEKRPLDLDEAPTDDHPADDPSDFELSMDDLPVAELNEEELRLDDESTPIVEDE